MTRWSTPCADCGRPTKATRCSKCAAQRRADRKRASLTGAKARRAQRQERAAMTRARIAADGPRMPQDGRHDQKRPTTKGQPT